MNTSEFDGLRDRIVRLESETRWRRRSTVALLTIGFGLLGNACQGSFNASDVVVAKSFAVQDEKGNVRALLGPLIGGGIGLIIGSATDGGGAAIKTMPDGSTHLTLEDKDNHPSFHLSALPDGSRTLSISDSEGKVRLIIGTWPSEKSTGVVLAAKDQTSGLQLRIGETTDSGTLQLFDTSGSQTVLTSSGLFRAAKDGKVVPLRAP